MHLILIISLFVLPVIHGANLPFTFEDCGPRDKTISFQSFDINPKPLVMHLKTDLKVKVNMMLKQMAGIKTQAKVKVHKVMGRWNIPLLSIKKPFCNFLDDVTFKQILCPLFTADNSGQCTCPVPAGSYKSDTAVITMDLAKLPVPKLLFKLGSGNWQMEITVSENEKTIGCLRLRSHVKIEV